MSEDTISQTDARLNSHEAVCAFRYEQINARLKRLETLVINAAGLMIISMIGVLFTSLWMGR